MYPPEVADNIRYLQRQIHEIATAPMGPNAVGPDQGHIRFFDANGDTFHIEPGGPLVKHKGALTGLIPLLEGHADRLTTYGQAITSLGTRTAQNESDIAAHGQRLNSYGDAITGLGTRMAGAESDIGAHGTRLNNYGNAITGLGTRMGAAEGDINTLQATKAAVSYVDSVSSRTTTAQNRADAAYSLAASKAAVSYVDEVGARASDALQRATDAQNDVGRIIAWINRNFNVSFPADIPR